jgi:tetratricopeptide (TPR) repeat protein
MMRLRLRALTIPTLAGSLACLVAPSSGAQRRPPQEFTRQGLLITNFAVGNGVDLKTGRRIGDAVRGQIEKLVDKRAMLVIDDYDIRDRMYRAGFNPDSTYTEDMIFSIGRALRADEYVDGLVTRDAKGYRLAATVILMRDKRMRQPLPAVTGATIDEAGTAMAKQLSLALSQSVYVRRCENSLRELKGAQALTQARAAVAQYPNAALARICLAWALRQTGAPAAAVLDVSQQVLAIDPNSYHAIESAAIALDSLHRRDAAADMWLRLAATDTTNLGLALGVIDNLVKGGSAKRAEPFVLKLSDSDRENLSLAQQKWRVTFETRNWPRALEAGEFMVKNDSMARADSTFWLRLGTVYRNSNKPLRAIEVLAHGVSTFPGDPRLYSLYTQYVKTEADTVLPRGLDLFPRSAELQAINARELRTRGKLAESLEASKKAIELDSTMSQGEMMVAQLEIELGRPDSALSAMRRALAHGDDSSMVAQFALSKGNALYRAANGTRTSNDFSVALRLLAFSDSIRHSVQATFLMGATALGLAQAALTEAPKSPDKAESCRLAKLGGDMIPLARNGLQAGQDTYGDAAKQSLDYVTQLEPYVGPQVTAFCAPPVSKDTAPAGAEPRKPPRAEHPAPAPAAKSRQPR